MSKSLPEGHACPGRILTEVGGGFAIGAVGGSAFHFLKGVRASPNGARITGGMQALRMNGPRVGGVFAVWSGLYSTFNCTAAYVRQKEDPWNSIVAGASTSALLSARQGLRAAGRSAVFVGGLFALFEGLGVVLGDRFQAAQEQQNGPQVHDPNLAAQQNVDLAAAVVNRLHAAEQNLPQVDDPATAAGGAGFQGYGDAQETKKPNDNGGEL